MPILIPKHAMLRPHGTAHVTEADGREVIRDTVQCVHCGRHGVYRPGSGGKLGYCGRCSGPTCPNPRCGGECHGPAWERC